jgi:hypothetical protein
VSGVDIVGIQLSYPLSRASPSFPVGDNLTSLPVKDPQGKTVRWTQLWVNYRADVDSLTVYFTGKPVPSVWDDIDDYAYIGVSLENENVVTGVKIEHFSKWLIAPTHSQQELQQP